MLVRLTARRNTAVGILKFDAAVLESRAQGNGPGPSAAATELAAPTCPNTNHIADSQPSLPEVESASPLHDFYNLVAQPQLTDGENPLEDLTFDKLLMELLVGGLQACTPRWHIGNSR